MYCLLICWKTCWAWCAQIANQESLSFERSFDSTWYPILQAVPGARWLQIWSLGLSRDHATRRATPITNIFSSQSRGQHWSPSGSHAQGTLRKAAKDWRSDVVVFRFLVLVVVFLGLQFVDLWIVKSCEFWVWGLMGLWFRGCRGFVGLLI